MSVTVKCPFGHEVVVTDEFAISGHSEECGLCGSHGGVTIRFTCDRCNKTRKRGESRYEVEVNSW